MSTRLPVVIMPIYANIKSLRCTPETNNVICQLHLSERKKGKRENINENSHIRKIIPDRNRNVRIKKVNV